MFHSSREYSIHRVHEEFVTRIEYSEAPMPIGTSTRASPFASGRSRLPSVR